jgi:anti-anti-sigma factor
MMPSPTKAPHAYYGHVEDTCVLRLTGPIRFVAAQALRQFVDDVIAQEDYGSVLIDLRGVDAIDSTGMGLLARVGRASLRARARRAAIVCPDNDIAACLRSAAFDELFVMLDAYPFEERATVLEEVPLDALGCQSEGLGRVILDAHRDLASVSDRNLDAYRDVIAALEADLRAAQRH